MKRAKGTPGYERGPGSAAASRSLSGLVFTATDFRHPPLIPIPAADSPAALASGAPAFVLLDVRRPPLFAQSHMRGALNLPHGRIVPCRPSAKYDDWLNKPHERSITC
ncbi:hypothetical protein [Paraburkholderia panacisoli]|uniref:hypothetical protein n=1 Tax=Paraburkholderia panacisoli TaxID=2603818 RepID=UPI003CCC834B